MEIKNNFQEKSENRKNINIMSSNQISLEEKNKIAKKQDKAVNIEKTNIIEKDEDRIQKNLKKIEVGDKKISKLSQIIKKRDEYLVSVPLNLRMKFNTWKNFTFIKEEKIERRTKKLLIKKTLNSKRGNVKPEIIEREKPKTIKILKQITPLKNNEEIKRKRKRIIKFIESRVTSYISKKDILKKYYIRWSSKVFSNQSENKINANKLENKMEINIIQEEEEKNSSDNEQKDRNKNKKISDISQDLNNERISFLKNVFKYKDPLSICFNFWKSLSNNEKIETINKKKKILIKKTKLKNDQDIKEPKIIKILKPTGINKDNENKKRKQKLIKFIESRITTYKTNKDILRKYYNRWISILAINIKKDISISKIKIKPNKPDIDLSRNEEKKDITNGNKNEGKKGKLLENNIEIISTIKDKKIQIIEENNENININNNIKENIKEIENKELDESIKIIEKGKNEIELNDKKMETIKKNENENSPEKITLKEKLLESTDIKEIDSKNEEIKEKENIKKQELIQEKEEEVLNENEKLEVKEKKLKKLDINDISTKNKIRKIIQIVNPIKIYFNKWRDFLDFEEKEIIENGIKKIVLSKKKLILKRDDIKPEDNKEHKIITIYKKPLKEKSDKGKEKIIKLIQNRIINYRRPKDILNKYYNIWKMNTEIINEANETIVNKIINKKVISLIKTKKEEDNILIIDNKNDKVEDNNNKNFDNISNKENKEIIQIENKDQNPELIKNEKTEPQEKKEAEIIYPIEIKNEISEINQNKQDKKNEVILEKPDKLNEKNFEKSKIMIEKKNIAQKLIEIDKLKKEEPILIDELQKNEFINEEIIENNDKNETKVIINNKEENKNEKHKEIIKIDELNNNPIIDENKETKENKSKKEKPELNKDIFKKQNENQIINNENSESINKIIVEIKEKEKSLNEKPELVEENKENKEVFLIKDIKEKPMIEDEKFKFEEGKINVEKAKDKKPEDKGIKLNKEKIEETKNKDKFDNQKTITKMGDENPVNELNSINIVQIDKLKEEIPLNSRQKIKDKISEISDAKKDEITEKKTQNINSTLEEDKKESLVINKIDVDNIDNLKIIEPKLDEENPIKEDNNRITIKNVEINRNKKASEEELESNIKKKEATKIIISDKNNNLNEKVNIKEENLVENKVINSEPEKKEDEDIQKNIKLPEMKYVDEEPKINEEKKESLKEKEINNIKISL